MPFIRIATLPSTIETRHLIGSTTSTSDKGNEVRSSTEEVKEVLDFCHSFNMLTDQDDDYKQYLPLTKRNIGIEYPLIDTRSLKEKRNDYRPLNKHNGDICTDLLLARATSVHINKLKVAAEHTSYDKSLNRLDPPLRSAERKSNVSMETSDHLACTETFDSNKNSFDERWRSKFNELVEFLQEHGHCNVPFGYPPNEQLGFWVRNQRYKLKRRCGGKASALTLERIEALSGLGFIFNFNYALWHQRYSELVQFKEKYGHCNVPHKYASNRRLASWVDNQRTQFKRMLTGKPSHLNTQRIEDLVKIGFEWALNIEYKEKLKSLIN